MRILVITPGLGIGGTERSAQNFCYGYKNYGHDVIVLNHGEDGIRRQYLEKEGIKVYAIKDNIYEMLNSIELGIFDVAHIHREGRYNKKENTILRYIRKSVTLIVETNVFYAIDYSYGNSLIDLHLHLTKINRIKWLKRGGKGKSYVLPNPVNTNDYPIPSKMQINEFKNKHLIPHNAYVFGRVGQPISGKWHVSIIKSFEKLAKENDNIYLLLIGAPNTIKKSVNNIISNIRDRIIIVDVIKDPQNLGICYSAMDSFIHIAKQGESFGYVLVEAIIYGLPVLTLNTPHRDNAQTEIIRHNIDGMVVMSEKYIYEGMKSIMNKNNKKTYNNAIKSESALRYDISKVCNEALSLYKNIIDGNEKEENDKNESLNYYTDGIGNVSGIEILLAKIYDYPAVNFFRESLKIIKRYIK